MRVIILLVLFMSIQCVPCKETNSFVEKPIKTYNARITYYSTDKRWGNRVACQRTKYAKEGIAVAAHPDFKFGTKIFIPELKDKIGDGNFTVQDRGGDVTNKKASKGRNYVFDIYVSSHSKISKYARTLPKYMKVYVIKS